ncbi:hypothetical protein [Rhabdothermincola salaria]|uniref:hypothetical protein n=1 Tax=Rhabdothermincola salaria TaxID=2903142 RepID=UPI001E65D300|nr:hypothetical protein [Rhabdothermincola salaria]MCD9624231.1 hypothetical protein [Rhabdothermincola salaria]
MVINAAIDRLWGAGDIDAVFGHHDRTVVPWPTAPRKKHDPRVDPDLVHRVLAGPPTLADIDPRDLYASQPWVVRQHVAYYLTGRWERTGTTSADVWSAFNRYPVVHIDAQGRHILFGGHHRSMAALLEGRPLRARVRRLSPDQPLAVLPHLLVGSTTPFLALHTADHRTAAAAVSAGSTVLVPTVTTARRVLRALELAPALVADRLRHIAPSPKVAA